MITLNKERGFVAVESWEEIESMPGYTPNLDPAVEELADMIAGYTFPDRRHCGLSNCHTPHGSGYVVVAKSGRLTRIGHLCGKAHFGVEFVQMSAKFERARNEQINRELIASCLRQEETRTEHLNSALEEGGALYRTLQFFQTRSKGCPEEVVKLVSRMIRNRNSALTTEREATKEEADQMDAMNGRRLERPVYIEEEVGYLAGMAALFPENNIRDLLVIDLQQNWDELRKLDVDTMDERDLRKWARWCQMFDAKIETAHELIGTARTFLAPENLRKVELVLFGKALLEYREHVATLVKESTSKG